MKKYIEITLLLICGVYLIIRWFNCNVTVGDFFILELFAIISYYTYEDFRK